MGDKEDVGMKFRKLIIVGAENGEYLFDESIGGVEILIARIDVSDNIEYLENYLYVSDEFIKYKIKYMVDNKKHLYNRDVSKINVNDIKVLAYINSEVIAYEDDVLNNNYNNWGGGEIIGYDEFAIKRLLE